METFYIAIVSIGFFIFSVEKGGRMEIFRENGYLAATLRGIKFCPVGKTTKTNRYDYL